MSQIQAEDFHSLEGTYLCKAGSPVAGGESDIENHIIQKSTGSWEGWVNFFTGLPVYRTS